MSVTIKYKGNTIASASTEVTKTIKTSGKYCEADIIVENTPDGGITPTGNINITDTNVTDVTNYATAQVVDTDLVAGNIKKDVNILGVVGSFEGGGAEITDGIVVKARDANGYATEVDIYGTVVAPQQFGYSWDTAAGGNSLTKVTFKDDGVTLYASAFTGNRNLVDMNVEKIQALRTNCLNYTKITNGNFANATSIVGACLRGISTITDLKFPKVTNFGIEGAFNSMTNLATIQLGSIGYGVTSVRYDVMYAFTFTGTLTCYCIGSYVDSFLPSFRNYGGANATIVFKASENTTYNGNSYLAGETILTSTPT